MTEFDDAARIADELRDYQADDDVTVADAAEAWTERHGELALPLARLVIERLRRTARSMALADAQTLADPAAAPDEVVARCRAALDIAGWLPPQAIDRLLEVAQEGVMAADALAELTTAIWPILNRLNDPGGAHLRERLSMSEFDREVSSQRAELEELRRWRREGPVAIVEAVLPLIDVLTQADVHGVTLASWLTQPTAWLSGDVPVEIAITNPQRALRAAEAFAGPH